VGELNIAGWKNNLRSNYVTTRPKQNIAYLQSLNTYNTDFTDIIWILFQKLLFELSEEWSNSLS